MATATAREWLKVGGDRKLEEESKSSKRSPGGVYLSTDITSCSNLNFCKSLRHDFFTLYDVLS